MAQHLTLTPALDLGTPERTERRFLRCTTLGWAGLGLAALGPVLVLAGPREALVSTTWLTLSLAVLLGPCVGLAGAGLVVREVRRAGGRTTALPTVIATLAFLIALVYAGSVASNLGLAPLLAGEEGRTVLIVWGVALELGIVQLVLGQTAWKKASSTPPLEEAMGL